MTDPLADKEERDRNWRDYGICGQTDPDMWFPEKGQRAKSQRARKMCNTQCEVREQCLRYALNNPAEQFGIWGGYSADELRRMRRDLGLDGAHYPADMEPEDESIYH